MSTCCQCAGPLAGEVSCIVHEGAHALCALCVQNHEITMRMARCAKADSNVRALGLCAFGCNEAEELWVLRAEAQSAVCGRITERLPATLDAPMCARMSQDALTVLDSVLVSEFIFYMMPVYSIARLC